MAIEMTCPGCERLYRLKDELAGKKVACKNPDCRRAFVVPSATAPVAASSGGLDTETLAAMAFREDADANPVEAQSVPMTCVNCDHQFTVTADKQGKNVLCPDCRTPQRVPFLQKAKQARGGPSLAKQPELEGVVSSTDASYARPESFKQAGVGLPELEPRSLGQILTFTLVPLGLLLALGVGAYSLTRSRDTGREIAGMKKALEEMPDSKDASMPPGEVPLARAALLIASSEYAMRRADKTPKELLEGVQALSRARKELEDAPPSTGRDYLFERLALAHLLCGGSDQEVKDEQRIRFTPQAVGNSRARVNEKVYDVQSELRQTAQAMRNPQRPAGVEVRQHVLRLVSRELLKSGHAGVPETLLPALFADEEQAEARAWIACEAFGASQNAEAATAEVVKLNDQLQGKPAGPGLLTLAQVASGAPPVLKQLPPPPPAGALDETVRAVYANAALLRKNAAEAVALAARPGRTDGRLRALSDCAGAAEPAAVAAALGAILADARKPEAGTALDLDYVRAAYSAGRAGKPELAEECIKLCGQPDGKALCRAEFLRGQLDAGAPVPESAAEMPADPVKELRLGHLLGKLLAARANAAVGGPELGLEGWAKGTARPFGRAGEALGHQDRARARS